MTTKRLALAASVLVLLGCRADPAPPISVAVGTDGDERVEFSPRSAFAEYVELPGVKNELRITLASYEASCERFIPPERGQASLTIVVVTPAGVVPTASGYGWNGESRGAHASPSVRLGPRSHALPAGGSIELEKVELDLHGRIEGRLAFEFAGTAEREATHARGAFRARVCRSKRAEP